MNAITIAVCHPPPYTQGTTRRPIPFSFEFFNQIQCKTERHHWASPGVFRLFPFRHCFTLPLPLHDIRTSLTFPPYLPTRSSFPYFAFSAHTAHQSAPSRPICCAAAAWAFRYKDKSEPLFNIAESCTCDL